MSLCMMLLMRMTLVMTMKVKMVMTKMMMVKMVTMIPCPDAIVTIGGRLEEGFVDSATIRRAIIIIIFGIIILILIIIIIASILQICDNRIATLGTVQDPFLNIQSAVKIMTIVNILRSYNNDEYTSLMPMMTLTMTMTIRF